MILLCPLAIFHIGHPDKSSASIWNNKIQNYWHDKAGGYGIQDPFGMKAIEWINGDYYNVVGLPICRLCQCLKKYGIDV